MDRIRITAFRKVWRLFLVADVRNSFKILMMSLGVNHLEACGVGGMCGNITFIPDVTALFVCQSV